MLFKNCLRIARIKYFISLPGDKSASGPSPDSMIFKIEKQRNEITFYYHVVLYLKIRGFLS